ncbi:MAG: hypothetical protein HY920_02485 [Elusimicrobia bacterium]|nr:hypothetical protein [Elusimicrobiota bacterium]
MFRCKPGLRILVIALAMAAFLSVSLASAREETYNFNTKSPMTAAFRSLMLPGWGQFFNEQPTKGLIFAGAELVAVGTAFMMSSKANSTYSDYETKRTSSLYDDYSSQIDTANMFVYLAAAIWAGNVFDAYLSADSGTSTKSIKSKKSKKSSTIKKSGKRKKVKVEEEEEEPSEEQIQEETPEEDTEEEDDESRFPGNGFYLQAKGLNQIGLAYRYTF